MPGVVDGEEPFAVAHGEFVLGPDIRPHIAPIALKVPTDKGSRIFLRFDQGHERTGGNDHPAHPEAAITI